jgi:hypothetical protein
VVDVALAGHVLRVRGRHVVLHTVERDARQPLPPLGNI